MFGRAGLRVGSRVVSRRGVRSFSGGPAMEGGSPSPQAMAAAALGFCSLLAFARGSPQATPPAEAQAVAEVVVPAPVVQENVTITLGVDDETIEALTKRVAKLEGQFARMEASATNQAFVFIKPHAANDKVTDLVAKGLEAAGITINDKGSISHSVIGEKQLIDNHYGAIASKASVVTPADQNVNEKGQAGFEAKFGESWPSALANNKVFNAREYCEAKGIDGAELDNLWSKIPRDELIKFGGGHYCGKIGDEYVINGFYAAMRDKYCKAPAKINYFLVSWNPSALSWEDFRGKVLGGTNPAEAAKGSLRKTIFDTWEELGLPAKPDTGDNGVHASASPFEAMAERANWVGKDIKEDTFGKAALSVGVAEGTLKEWMKDAQVVVEGKKQSIFDFLEDQNSDENLDKLAQVLKESN